MHIVMSFLKKTEILDFLSKSETAAWAARGRAREPPGRSPDLARSTGDVRAGAALGGSPGIPSRPGEAGGTSRGLAGASRDAQAAFPAFSATLVSLKKDRTI